MDFSRNIVLNDPSIYIEWNVAKFVWHTVRDPARILCTALGVHCDSSPQKRIVIEKTDQEEAAANRLVASVVEHEQHETTEMSTSVEMSATTINTNTVTTKKCTVNSDVHDPSIASIVKSTVDRPLERSANLSLTKQEIGLVDTLRIPNPASPISKQVSRSSNKFLSC